MVINLLYKNTLKKIKKSFGRYISLFIIVMIGVGFFAGIQATTPDIIDVADKYYKESNLLDFKVVSTLGLTDQDVNAIKKLSNVGAVIPSYSLDVLDTDKATRVHAIEDKVNTFKLEDGRMPQKHDECIADSKTYKIGDKIKITSNTDKKLKIKEYTVTGIVRSVLYLAEDYGNTTIGDGKLSSFIFINKDNFILDAYTEIYLIAAGTDKTEAYSKEYDTEVSKLKDELLKIKSDRENARYQEIYTKADSEIRKNETKLNDEKKMGQKKLADAKATLDENAEKLEKGKSELIANEAELKRNTEKQNAEFASAKEKISAGWKDINNALDQNKIKKEEIDTKINELNSAIRVMKAQLSQLPVESQEYIRLNATINQYSEMQKGLLKLKQSITTLTAQEAKLDNGIDTFNSEIAKAKRKIEQGKIELAQNEKKLKDGYTEYSKNVEKFNTEIIDAQTKLTDAKKEVSDIEKPKWHIFGREAAGGYNELKSGIDVVTSVAALFPFFFILIVMLMASNSMVRMIEEERSELGTLTSLGYKDGSIISTYLFYVLSASGLGAVVGFFTGCGIIPPLIYSTFRFNLPPLVIKYSMGTFSIILLITFALMSIVTVVSCNKELKQKPSTLMRPVPPENGKTIVLERIKPLWGRLSFTWKVTLRNMFRYKKRAFMTIVGVAGCTALLLVGFGLRDSMNGVAEKQYGEIFRYDNMFILKNEIKNIQGDLENLLTREQVKEPLLLKQTALKCETKNKSYDAFLIVPANEDVFYKYFNLKTPSEGVQLTLNGSGVIITQKLSEVYNAGKGDTITVKDAENNSYKLTVTGVAENYTADYIYMNNQMYNRIFGKAASYNAIVSNHKTDETAFAEKLIDSGLVLNVVFNGDLIKKVLDSNESLNSIILLIVVVASLLAIIVLYNLTSINISERTREIATLKVLGFTDEETNGYIYREAFILTLISIGVGLVLGIYIHSLVIDVIGENSLVLFKKIKWLSFLLAALLTVIFSVVMQIVTYFKLQTIDMIESLKSVE
ncbi:ABC transporter permease [Ruminiclostridium cellulolyticum]|uniref:FtsX-like permease family protein n=1 Tax=Ruminiclostridium cellulolyticum TaxID=1521 RepID=UPI0005A2DEE0